MISTGQRVFKAKSQTIISKTIKLSEGIVYYKPSTVNRLKSPIMKLKITIGLFLATFLLSAQTARMNRDIEVIEKILETLVEEVTQVEGEETRYFRLGKKVEGNYIDGFGAMFTISKESLSGTYIWTKNKKQKVKQKGDVFIIRKGKNVTVEEVEANKEKVKANFKKIVESFASDYAYLMRQLKDDDKVMIRYGAPSMDTKNNFPDLLLHNKKGQNYTATITKIAIDAYQNNNDEVALINKIDYVFEEAAERVTKEKDLELLSTILKKLYSSHEEGDFHISGTPYYEKIEGIGARYVMNIRTGNGSTLFGLVQDGTRTVWTDHGFRTITLGKDEDKTDGLTAKELEEKYVVFIKEMKENIIDYGSLVKSLNSDESLTFTIHLPKCKGCEKMPKEVEIMAKKATIDAYRKDQITLEKAVNQLIIE